MLGLGIVFQGALPARGCTFVQPDSYASLVATDGVFVGALGDVACNPGSVHDSSIPIDVEFEIEEAPKGDVRDTIVVKSAADGAWCGFGMPVGQRGRHPAGSRWRSMGGQSVRDLDADALLADPDRQSRSRQNPERHPRG